MFKQILVGFDGSESSKRAFQAALHLASESGGVPELKRVIVAYENSIAMEATLEESLLRIFGGSPAPATATTEETAPVLQPGTSKPVSDVNQLIAEANRQFTIGQEELKRGNWSGYGEAMKKVEQLLGELGKRAGKQK